MGRKLTFCKDTALQKAMGLFWQKGFDATSMRDIADASDVPLASLYNTFGDKRALFLSSLDCYMDTCVAPALAATEHKSADARAALRDFFLAMADAAQKEDPGCYLVQVAGQLKTTAPDLSAAAMQKLDAVRARFQGLIEEAQRQGTIPAHQSARALSEYLIGTMLAVKTWSRAGAGPDTLRDYITRALAVM